MLTYIKNRHLFREYFDNITFVTMKLCSTLLGAFLIAGDTLSDLALIRHWMTNLHCTKQSDSVCTARRCITSNTNGHDLVLIPFTLHSLDIFF